MANNYRWSNAADWLLWKIDQLSGMEDRNAAVVELASLARELARNHDCDQIQDSFQSEMDEDGFFDTVAGG